MSDLRVPDLNNVFIAGRLTRDPDLKYTANGKAYCRMGVANTRYFKGQDGERREDTTFVDVVVWGPQAEFVGERLRKGRPVLIEGSLKTSEWEDRETGKKRSKVEINGRRVTPLDWDNDGGSRGGGGGYSGGSGGGDRPARDVGGSGSPRPIEEPVPEDDIPF